MGRPARATHQHTRAYNAGLVLRTVYDLGPISRADVARQTGLTRTSVGEIVGGLITDGLAAEVGRGPSSGGKAPILVQVVDDARSIVALDLGESFTGAVVNLRGDIRATVEVEVGDANGDAALALVFDLVDGLMSEVPGVLLGIGVGTPGIVDTASGTIHSAVNLDWQELPLGRLLSERYGVPVAVANDTRAAAMAEALFGVGGMADNLVAIKVGRGIGAGVVIGGELFHGDGSSAGEIGHTVVVDDGAACRCGRFGCLETVASSRAIVRRALEAANEAPGSWLGRRLAEHGDLQLDDVVAAVEAGDESARLVAVSAGRYLGGTVAALASALDIERIVLLGTVTCLGEPWLAAVREEASRRSLPSIGARTRIEITTSRGNETVQGAAALLLTGQLGLSIAR